MSKAFTSLDMSQDGDIAAPRRRGAAAHVLQEVSRHDLSGRVRHHRRSRLRITMIRHRMF
ncbi:hypothetical protein [Streptomyces sp. NPDC058657]|uniref:hypothetical protein n=1 Tax=unclassified Streptomyces TaxID=2593676 RepID=UPI0036517085